MMIFWLVAAAMMLLGVSLVLVPLLRPSAQLGPARRDLNTAVYKERLKELQAERDNGTLEADAFEQARVELERSLLDDLSGAEATPAAASRPRRLLASLTLIALVPLAAVLLYHHFGRSDLVDTKVDLQALANGDHRSLAYVVNQLVGHVRAHPDDPKGWKLLGRSYAALDRYEDAVRAYTQANRLDPHDPQTLVDFAEALSVHQGDSMKGQPQALVAEALQQDPGNQKGLWLAGIAAYQDSDYKGAIQYWSKLQSLVPADSEGYRVVSENIANAKSLMASAAEVPQGATAAPSNAHVAVKVALAPQFKQQADPNTTVFIYARAVNGPPMPLAILKVRVRDLPVSVTLDDSMSMAPIARLSRYPEVMVFARVSPSGQAMPQSGDLQGSVGPVKVGADQPVSVTIDSRVP